MRRLHARENHDQTDSAPPSCCCHRLCHRPHGVRHHDKGGPGIGHARVVEAVKLALPQPQEKALRPVAVAVSIEVWLALQPHRGPFRLPDASRGRPACRLGSSLEAAGQPSSHFALTEDLIGKQPPHSWRARHAHPHLAALQPEGDAAPVATTLERRPRPSGIRNLRATNLQPESGKLCWHVSRILPGYRLRGTYVHLHLHEFALTAGAKTRLQWRSNRKMYVFTYLHTYET